MGAELTRAVWGVTVLLLAAACSASDAVPEVDDASSIEIEAGADDVVLILGSYNIAENIDEFVRGPDLVIYADGSIYRDTARLDGGAPTRFQRGEISQERLIDIVAAARALPTDADTTGCGEDEGSTMLDVEDRSWSECGLRDAPEFGAFIDAVDDEMNSIDMTEWIPSALVEHVPLGGACAVVESSTLPLYQTAAVYPHVVERFPLGEFDCPWG